MLRTVAALSQKKTVKTILVLDTVQTLSCSASIARWFCNSPNNNDDSKDAGTPKMPSFTDPFHKGPLNSAGFADEAEEEFTEEEEYVNPVTGERGGPKGPEPTRYGDWERKGRVSDF